MIDRQMWHRSINKIILKRTSPNSHKLKLFFFPRISWFLTGYSPGSVMLFAFPSFFFYLPTTPTHTHTYTYFFYFNGYIYQMPSFKFTICEHIHFLTHAHSYTYYLPICVYICLLNYIYVCTFTSMLVYMHVLFFRLK